MTSDDINKTAPSRDNTPRKSQETVVTKPKLQPWLAEDVNEWEGFDDNGKYDEF